MNIRNLDTFILEYQIGLIEGWAADLDYLDRIYRQNNIKEIEELSSGLRQDLKNFIPTMNELFDVLHFAERSGQYRYLIEQKLLARELTSTDLILEKFNEFKNALGRFIYDFEDLKACNENGQQVSALVLKQRGREVYQYCDDFKQYVLYNVDILKNIVNTYGRNFSWQ